MWMAVKRGIVVAIGLLIQILLTLFIYFKIWRIYKYYSSSLWFT